VGRDNFGIIYEPANLEQCGEDYGPDTVGAYLPYTFNVYLQNLRISAGGESNGEAWSRGKFRFDQVPMWEDGGLDFAPGLAALEEAGYEGYVTLHQAATPPVTTEEFVVETARYLKGLATFS
jgi:sugar phosphate isomerase/epimerase